MPWLVNLQGVSKAWSEPLFTDLDCIVHAGDRLGIIGPNGSGKSTLLGLITGRIEADAGQRLMAQDCVITTVAQQDDFPTDATPLGVPARELARTALQPNEQELRVQRLLQDGGFDPERADTPVQRLSGGWRKRLAILRAMARDPDLVCCDEPTNHLDPDGCVWLEQLLTRRRIGAVLVSHDRWFLEQVATRVLAIDPRHPGGVFNASGGYGDFLIQQAQALEEQQHLESRLRNRWRQEAAWLARRPKARTTKAAFRVAAAGDLQQDLGAVQARNRAGGRAGISFSATGRRANELIDATGIARSFGTTVCFSDCDCCLAAGERIGILGGNGSGKTTLMRVLGGELEPDAGRVRHAHALRVARFSQHREELDRSATLRAVLAPGGDTVQFAGRSQHVMAWAKRFLFQPQQLDQTLASLSGGEQARALIATMMSQPADVLLLDEPTNDLDIATLEILEEALLEFAGGVLLISHDRYLMQRVCDRFIALDGRGAAEQVASYDQWEQRLRAAERERVPEAVVVATRPTPDQKPAAQVDRRQIPLNRKELGELKRVEERIAGLEAEQTDLQQQLMDPAIFADADAAATVQERIDGLDGELVGLLERWEELEERRS
ncbi:MAG: ABC-F family ATP-binding cassette domain-containing protein [Planctomycetota bacterium]